VWEKLLCRLNDIRCRFETSPFFKHHEVQAPATVSAWLCTDTPQCRLQMELILHIARFHGTVYDNKVINVI